MPLPAIKRIITAHAVLVHLVGIAVESIVAVPAFDESRSRRGPYSS